jgi:two-component system CheB/CheR fusion protein
MILENNNFKTEETFPMEKKKRTTTMIAGAGLFFLAVVAVLASFGAFIQTERAADLRRNTSYIINDAGNLLSELKDAETGVRGYLLTGNKTFLEPYNAVQGVIKGHLAELSKLKLTGEAGRHLDTLAPLVAAKSSEMSGAIKLREKGDMTAVIAAVSGGYGKRIMDSIRTEINGFILIEEGELVRFEVKFRENIQWLFIVITAASILMLALAFSFVFMIYRETRARLKDVMQAETVRLLGVQENMNAKLQRLNSILQVSEEKFSVTLNSIGDAVLATDDVGNVTLLNPHAEKLTGWTHAEAIGRPVEEIFRIINQKTRLPSVIPVKKTLEHGTVHGLANNTILIARGGIEYVIADSCAPIRDREGSVLGAVLVFRDITERSAIEMGLEKSKMQLDIIKKSEDEAREYSESIINTIREPLIALDQDLRVVSVSRSFYEVFKVKPEETVGQLIYDLGNKQWNIPKLRELLETILPQKATFDNYVVEHDFAAIGRRIMLLNARQIQRMLGKERIILLAIEDITERREIENGLEKARKELETTKIAEDAAREYSESIINTLREPLIVLDQDLRVVSVSRAFYEFFKVNPEDTVGQLIYDLGNKQWNIPKLRELLETILPQKATFDNYEVEHNFANIGRRIMLLNARQIKRVLGKERIILLSIEDITGRRDIENGLERAREEMKALATELKRAATAKSEFLANMSHELRTPLNSINGFSEVLFDETFGPLNEKQKKYVNNVLTSGKHLLLLINQILDMAKVESGKMKLSITKLPMKNLLTEISLLVADMAGKKNLQIELDLADDLPAIEADELKVKEIIYNLLSNAVKFTPDGGKIGIRAKLAGDAIEVEVWDTGVGIARENMEKIFEGFFRVDTPYSRVTEGTGLGLPLSKKMVELHGGKFFVRSKGLNQGTLVRFVLPIRSESVA